MLWLPCRLSSVCMTDRSDTTMKTFKKDKLDVKIYDTRGFDEIGAER